MASKKVKHDEELRLAILLKLKYDPKTGIVRWKDNFGGRAFKNRIAGENKNGHHGGRKSIGINGTAIRTTYAIWVLMTGSFPKHVIDHIDSNPSNDKWCNLQDIPKSDDCSKKSIQSNNTSGITGIHKTNKGKYTVQVRKKGKFLINKTVGSIQEAIELKRNFQDVS